MKLVVKRQKLPPIVIVIFLFIFVALIGFVWLANGIAENVLRTQVQGLVGDDIKMRSVHVSFLRGAEIVARDITVAQPPGYGEEPLLKAKSLRIRFDLLPLFNRQLMVRGIHINSPALMIVQKKDGHLNTEYYLEKFKGGTKKNDNPFTVQLRYFRLQNAELTVVSPRLSDYQPAFHMRACDLVVRDLSIPNPNRNSSRFTFKGSLITTRTVPIRLKGNGVFAGGPISFNADSYIKDLPLADFEHLYQRSSIRVKKGNATVISHANCIDGYLKSTHLAEVTNLKVERKRGVFRSLIYGLPANLFIKLVEDQHGVLKFRFSVDGRLSELKVHTKRTVSSAIGQGLKAKFSYIYKQGFKEKTVGGIKNLGKKTKQFFKKNSK